MQILLEFWPILGIIHSELRIVQTSASRSKGFIRNQWHSHPVRMGIVEGSIQVINYVLTEAEWTVL
jgi:hypothetical protein